MFSLLAVRNEWKLMTPQGKCPSKRRRQSCLVVGDKVFLFGGTSPYSGQLPHYVPEIGEDNHVEGLDAKLMDHNDLHILDFGKFFV